MIFAFTLKNAIKEFYRMCKIGDYVEFIEKDILFMNERNFTKSARLWRK